MALEAVVKLTKEQYEILANGGTVGPYTGIDNTKYLYFVQDDISAGSSTIPVYFLNGSPLACAHSLEADVPSDADFNNYYHTTGSWNGLTYTAGKVGNPDDLSFTIPTGTTGTTVALGNHNHDGTYLGINATAVNSDKLNGQAASYYASRAWVDDNYLGKTAKASDADKLDGHDSSYFATADHSHSQANLTSWLGLGTLNNSPSWGTVKSANGYTVIWGSDQPNGGGLVFGEKSGQTSMQIDGEIYVNEGSVRLAHVGEAQPASDVYSWAKQPSKPSYNFSEIQPGTAVVDYNGGIVFRNETTAWYSGIYYSTPSEEAVIFANKSQGNQDSGYQQQWLFAYTDMQNREAWTDLGSKTAMQIKGHRVAINKMVGNGAQIPYNLDVNGSANATTVTVATKMTMQYNATEDCIDFVFA